MNISHRAFAIFIPCLLALTFATVQADSGTSENDKSLETERQELLAEAKAVHEEARRSMEEARLAAEEERQSKEAQAEEMARMREELSRVHQQLREVSRQVALAHRELELTQQVDAIHPRDRAVLGVLLGKDNDDGVQVIGVTPDGPAEKAGLQQGDVLVAMDDVKLSGQADGARSALLQAMKDVSPGDELKLEVLRGAKTMKFTVVAEQREENVWQTVMRLPDAPNAPNVIVEKIEIPEIDKEKLASRIEEINKQLQNYEFRFADEDGEPLDFGHKLIINGKSFSDIGEKAMADADFWFGLPQARGLELASLNPGLGKYFKAERGVLVVQARADNAYGLESGDVIQMVDATEVNSPSDLLRALRDAEPGAKIALKIKRDRRDKTLEAEVPENRLGLMRLHKILSPAAPPAPPEVE